MQNCFHHVTLVILGFLLCVAGVLCFGYSIGMNGKLKHLNQVTNVHKYRTDNYVYDSTTVDECHPGFEDFEEDKAFVEYHLYWWIQACPEVKWNYTQRYVPILDESFPQYQFQLETFPAICSCKTARVAAIVLMALTGSLQILIGITFSVIGCLSPGACCRARIKWVIFGGFVLLFLLFSAISFGLALHFGMNQVDQDVKPNFREEIHALGRNEIGIAFTTVCGIDAILNFIAVILSVVGIIRANKSNNPTGAAQEENMETKEGEGQAEGQDQGQIEGQGSQGQISDPANPSTHSKSQTHSQPNVNGIVQSQHSSQKSSAR